MRPTQFRSASVHVRETTIGAEDGFPLAATVYEPAVDAGVTAIVHPALAVSQRYYARFAAHLASHGVRTYSFDYRGAGASRPDGRLPAATLEDWGRRDAPAVFRHVRARRSGRLVVVAHSIGGQILGFSDVYREADELVVVAAQLGHWRLFDGLRRAQLAALWHGVIPAVIHATGSFPGWLGLGMDLPAGVGLEWCRWGRDRDWFLGAHPDTRARLARLDRPMRFYSFEDDTVAPPAAVDAFVSLLDRAHVDHRALAPRDLGLDGIGHFGFFRPELRTPFWEEALEVVLGRAPLSVATPRA